MCILCYKFDRTMIYIQRFGGNDRLMAKIIIVNKDMQAILNKHVNIKKIEVLERMNNKL